MHKLCYVCNEDSCELWMRPSCIRYNHLSLFRGDVMKRRYFSGRFYEIVCKIRSSLCRTEWRFWPGEAPGLQLRMILTNEDRKLLLKCAIRCRRMMQNGHAHGLILLSIRHVNVYMIDHCHAEFISEHIKYSCIFYQYRKGKELLNNISHEYIIVIIHIDVTKLYVCSSDNNCSKALNNKPR